MKKCIKVFIALAMAILFISGCHGSSEETSPTEDEVRSNNIEMAQTDDEELEETVPTQLKETEQPKIVESFDPDEVPEYDGNPFVDIHNGQPYFDGEEYNSLGYEKYSDLDDLGRCGVAFACITKNTMPTEPRGEIGSIEPSGWQLTKYDILPDNYLYNRCHLIAFQLAGENDNEKNLITGTRYMNMEGMLPFENQVANYVNETGNPVLYKVTPCFEGDNLVADGVLMEAESEDGTICFCVYCYNVQPGIDINYADGSSNVNEEYLAQSAQESSQQEETGNQERSNFNAEEYDSNRSLGETIPEGTTYVLNTNTWKFHRTDCDSVGDMKPENTEYFAGSRDEVIARGFDPCGRCHP